MPARGQLLRHIALGSSDVAQPIRQILFCRGTAMKATEQAKGEDIETAEVHASASVNKKCLTFVLRRLNSPSL